MRTALLAAALALFVAPAQGQCFLSPLLPLGLPAPNWFGVDVTLDGDVAIVGSPLESEAGAMFAGAVYVYDVGPQGLSTPTRLVSIDPSENQGFGRFQATDGTRVAIASEPSSAAMRGVYVYVRSGGGWVFEQVLRPPVPSSSAYGSSLAIDGDRLAVRSNTGEIDVYERINGTWSLVDVLRRGGVGDYSGVCRLRFGGDRLFVHRDAWTNFDGHVEIWRRDPTDWTFEQRLLDDGPSSAPSFGHSLAVSGDRIAVGQPLWLGNDGRVDVYDRSGTTWTRTGRVEAPQDARRLGWDVSFEEGRLVASEFLFQGPSGRGAIATFEELGGVWTAGPRYERPATLPAAVGWQATALSGSRFLVEGQFAPPGGTSFDAPYLIDVEPVPDLRFCDAGANSTGLPGVIDVTGSRSVAAADAAIVASGLPSSTFVLFVYGPREGVLPLGNGTLCVDPLGGGLVRFDPAVLADGFGVAQVPFNPGTASPAAPLEPGRSYAFQAWYRDVAAGGALFDLTDAVRVTFCP
ncbi:MAG: hypothetical protein AAF957_23035 [Planctomycetota bacterium]